MKKRKRRMVWIIILSVIILIAVIGIIFVNQPSFGTLSKGERLERIKNVPNYYDDKFQNQHETRQLTSDKGYVAILTDFLFRQDKRLRPKTTLPVVKTDLHKLDRSEDILVWFGHSSYLLQIDGIRILVDPVFYDASPVSFYNRAFKGPDVYKPEAIPEIDYLVVSHDHWDHLDYKTVKELKNRTGKVICGLGVGTHFERWGFTKDRVIELNWNEEAPLQDGFKVYCLPARHFSGRGLSPNRSLWASYLIETPTQKIYIGGDSGYDTHYAEIGTRFGNIDLAILENGQYNEDWKYIHLLPEHIVQAFKDLNAKTLFTVHHSKYALGKHSWDEPLKNISAFAERDSIDLILPMMGETVYLKDSPHTINKWWEGIN